SRPPWAVTAARCWAPCWAWTRSASMRCAPTRSSEPGEAPQPDKGQLAMDFDAKHQCLVLSVDHGKVNALAQPLRQYLLDGLAQAATRDEVHWVLLRGGEAFFSAGADLAEVANGTAGAAPS